MGGKASKIDSNELKMNLGGMFNEEDDNTFLYKINTELNSQGKGQWEKDFEIIDNRDGQEFGEDASNWIVYNNVSGTSVDAKSKKDAEDIIKNAPAYDGFWNEGEPIDFSELNPKQQANHIEEFNRQKGNRKYKRGGAVGDVFIALSKTKNGLLLSERFDKEITHKQLFDYYKKRGYEIIDSNIFKVTNKDVLDVFKDAISKFIKEKYNELVDWDNSILSYQIVGDRIIAQSCFVQTKNGNQYKITPNDLFNKKFNGGGAVGDEIKDVSFIWRTTPSLVKIIKMKKTAKGGYSGLFSYADDDITKEDRTKWERLDKHTGYKIWNKRTMQQITNKIEKEETKNLVDDVVVSEKQKTQNLIDTRIKGLQIALKLAKTENKDKIQKRIKGLEIAQKMQKFNGGGGLVSKENKTRIKQLIKSIPKSVYDDYDDGELPYELLVYANEDDELEVSAFVSFRNITELDKVIDKIITKHKNKLNNIDFKWSESIGSFEQFSIYSPKDYVDGGGVGKLNYADGRKFRIRVKQKKG